MIEFCSTVLLTLSPCCINFTKIHPRLLEESHRHNRQTPGISAYCQKHDTDKYILASGKIIIPQLQQISKQRICQNYLCNHMRKSLPYDFLHTNKRQPCFHMDGRLHQLQDCGIQEINMCKPDHLQQNILHGVTRQLMHTKLHSATSNNKKKQPNHIMTTTTITYILVVTFQANLL